MFQVSLKILLMGALLAYTLSFIESCNLSCVEYMQLCSALLQGGCTINLLLYNRTVCIRHQ